MFSFTRKHIDKKELAEALREALDSELRVRGIVLAQHRKRGRPRKGSKVVTQG